MSAHQYKSYIQMVTPNYFTDITDAISWKFPHQNPFTRFWIMSLIETKTDKQSIAKENITFAGGGDMSQ